MNGEHAAQIEALIQHNLGAWLPAQPVEFDLDQWVTKPERQNYLIDAGAFQHAQVPLEQAHMTEA